MHVTSELVLYTKHLKKLGFSPGPVWDALLDLGFFRTLGAMSRVPNHVTTPLDCLHCMLQQLRCVYDPSVVCELTRVMSQNLPATLSPVLLAHSCAVEVS